MTLNNLLLKDRAKTKSHVTHSCFRSLSLILSKKGLTVSPDGKLFQVLLPDQYKIKLLQLCALIMIGFLAYMIRRFPYHHITIIGNTVYSRVAAATLSDCNISFVHCRDNNRISYYDVEDYGEIPLEGPNPIIFCESITSNNIPLIPLSKEEISRVEAHTKLRNLTILQETILSNCQKENNVPLIDLSKIIKENGGNRNPATQINKFFGNLYYVTTTTNEVWLTSIVINGNVSPLQPGDIISGLYGKIIPGSHSDYDITFTENQTPEIIITEPTQQIFLKRKSNYIVGPDLCIKNRSHDMDDMNESTIFSLERPRPFLHNSIYTIHPFHIPATWDLLLTIMIITRGIIMCNSYIGQGFDKQLDHK